MTIRVTIQDYLIFLVKESISLPYLLISLHAVLALDPGGHVGTPRQGPTKATKNIVPLDPAARGYGTRLLLQKRCLEARVRAGTQEAEG